MWVSDLGIGRTAFLLTDMMRLKVHLGADFETKEFVAVNSLSSSVCLIRKLHWTALKFRMPAILPRAQHVAGKPGKLSSSIFIIHLLALKCNPLNLINVSSSRMIGKLENRP